MSLQSLINDNSLNLAQHRLVKITACTCIIGYIATIVVYMTHCRPLHGLWQVYPYTGDDCALSRSNYYALVVSNVLYVLIVLLVLFGSNTMADTRRTTDVMILYIPLPLLWRVQLPLHKKLKFGVWLCGGVFIIVASLLRCILALKDSNSINVSTIWSIRETVRPGIPYYT